MTHSTQTPAPDTSEAYLRKRRFARECALQYLYQADVQAADGVEPPSLELFWEQVRSLENFLAEPLFEEARSFAERLMAGVRENLAELDRRITAYAENWTLERMSVVDRNILRLAAFELFWCADVPAVASINEAIELAKEFGHQDSGRFVNGILDRMLRERQAETKTSEPGVDGVGEAQNTRVRDKTLHAPGSAPDGDVTREGRAS
ncbi:MAG: transcription antitermination factor NusB [Lentisphaerae bacterium RIFOXYB12_FULL_65_16]|nr:MAG: transcription antitermination factor NusB [Lentisphaerae bacterium RIFOXYA12_64_32]OGV87578.1 MAG: transcription antitermination factor NusB [Lentisphaerae bacterium RIFOXYB12_FULL_65_16]